MYEGLFKDTKPHGQGIAYDKNGKAYEGKFKNGAPSGMPDATASRNTIKGQKFKLTWINHEWNEFKIINL